MQLPIRYKLYDSSAIHPLRVLSDGVYELRKGYSDWKLSDGYVVKLRLGGVVTGSTSQKLIKDVNIW